MPEYTGTFFDVDPENWKEYVDANGGEAGAAGGVCGAGSDYVRRGRTSSEVDYTGYWQAALVVVNAWSKYQGRKKLEINSSYPETDHKVAPVVDRYFGGSKSKLRDRVQELSEAVDLTLVDFALKCREYGVESVSRDWLYRNLIDVKAYASLRGKIKRRMGKNKPPASLKNL